MASAIVLLALVALSYGYTIRENPRHRSDERIRYYETYPEQQYRSDDDSYLQHKRRVSNNRYYSDEVETPALSMHDSDYEYQRRRTNDDYQPFDMPSYEPRRYNKKAVEDWLYGSNEEDNYPFKTITKVDNELPEMKDMKDESTTMEEEKTEKDEVEKISSDIAELEDKSQEKDEENAKVIELKEDPKIEKKEVKSQKEEKKEAEKDEEITKASIEKKDAEKESIKKEEKDEEIKTKKDEKVNKEDAEEKDAEKETIEKDEKKESIEEKKDTVIEKVEKDEEVKDTKKNEKELIAEDHIEKADAEEAKNDEPKIAEEDNFENKPKYKYDNLFKDEKVDLLPRMNVEKKDERKESRADLKTEDELRDFTPISEESVDVDDISEDANFNHEEQEEMKADDFNKRDELENVLISRKNNIENDDYRRFDFKESVMEEPNDSANRKYRYDIPKRHYDMNRMRDFNGYRPRPSYRQYDAPMYQQYYRSNNKREFPIRHQRREDYEQPVIRYQYRYAQAI